jgi:alanyl-tRNA synthetase
MTPTGTDHDRVGTGFSAVVTDIRLESRVEGQARWQMALDRTEFAAGDVGVLAAVARSGTRLEIAVLDVVADEAGDLWHVVEKPLAAGTDVVGRVGGR